MTMWEKDHFGSSSSSGGEADDDRDEEFKYASDSSESVLEHFKDIKGKKKRRSPERKRKTTRRRPTRKKEKRRRRRSSGGSSGTGRESVADTLSLDSSSEEDAHPVAERSKPHRQDPNTDRTPRIRRTENYPERVAMEHSREHTQTKIPPLPQLVFSSWSEFNDVLESYCSDHFLLFRARDTQTVATHNASKELQIPGRMEYSYKVFRCTHGCPQKSRSKGLRSTPSRYTGCKARFTASAQNISTKSKKAEWKIVLRNWTWTHNHRTNATIFASYFGAGGIPEDSPLLDQVGLLADANTETHRIQDFLAGALERHVTPQQARNIVRKVLKSTSPEKKLKEMLDTYVKFPDHDVLVLQDQNAVTCGVVLQSAVQKLAFKRWGETLCMDWTYGTNNLGFHLGSLLVTSSTGRGVPVLDFIAINEKMDTMIAILEFFKTHNSLWEEIETVVIDKDFKEWKVLEKCFPQATVLLCQFHTMANWKKVIKRVKYGLNGIQQDEVEYSIKQMMYSTTREAFNRARDGFEKFCKGECPDICSKPCPEIFAYFQENWETCSDMWANHGRGNYFTAGNTTTNRIESNWNQLKRLLGRKTRIDNTIAGLLLNQVNIVNHLLTTLRKFSTLSRRSDSIPPFLQVVAARLANNPFAKVLAQWDLFMVHQDEAKCVQVGPTQSEWKIFMPGREWSVNDLKWTCSCLFYKSRRLPCQHVMMVASKAHRFEALPAAAVPDRWNMKQTESLYSTLENSVVPLRQVINLVKARTSRVMAPQPVSGPQDTLDCGSRPGQHAVAYVRLRRREQANMVVLSDAEKYARAQVLFEPILEKLRRLPTVEFYQRMNDWKTIIEKYEGDIKTSESEIVSPGASESESDNVFAELELADVMAELEEDQELAMQVESIAGFARERSIAGQEISGVDVAESEAAASDSDIAPTQPSSAKEPDAPLPIEVDKSRNVEVLRLPTPQRRTRKKQRQLWSTPQPKYAAVLIFSEVTTTMPEIIQWANYHPNVEKVSNVLDQYPVVMTDKFIQARPVTCTVAEKAKADDHLQHSFVIPEQLLTKLEAIMMKKQTQLARQDELAPWGLMISMGPDLPALHSSFLYRMRSFYILKDRASGYLKDIKWLKQDWRLVQAHPVEPFSLETKTNGVLHSEAARIHQELADGILKKYPSLSLMTELKVKSGGCYLKFNDVVAGVPRRAMLNDAAIDMAITMITDSLKGCVAFSALTLSLRWPNPPAQWLSETPFVILPLHLSTDHWGVIIVEVAFPTTLKVHFYEPLHQDCYRQELKNAWKKNLLPYMEKWHVDSDAKEPFPKEIITRRINEPAQPDSRSCGIMILGVVYAFVRNAHRFERDRITEAYISVVRLRLVWLLLCTTKRLTPSTGNLMEMQKTDEAIGKILQAS